MKQSYKALALCVGMLGASLSSCNYLDVVPDENVTDRDTYSGRERGLGYLYSCYAYLPSHANTAGSLDRLTGDEVVTAFEHELFANFLKGNYTASTPVISYWNTLFEGIRRCYMFKERIDKLPAEATDAEKKDMHAQADFLIAYYHFLLLRCYGPTIVVRETPNINQKPADFPEREKLEDCIQFIVNKFDEAARVLPPSRVSNANGVFAGQRFYGLATSVAAKALKAKVLVYAASPLFNGGLANAYTDFKNSAGEHLMPQTADPQKWVTAKNAVKEAIDAATAAGHALYEDTSVWGANPYPEAGVERKLRSMLIDWRQANPEVLFADTRGDGYYDIQLKSAPRNKSRGHGANGTSPTWAMLNRFYTKNGLPWDKDPGTKNLNKLGTSSIDTEHEKYGPLNAQTTTFNLHREPRFYAWVGFHNGYYEIQRENLNVYDATMMPQNGRLILQMLKNQTQGRMSSGNGASNNYSPGGYLNKKGTNPNNLMKPGDCSYIHYPFAIMRLADLFLLYAETAVETDDLATAKEYLNKVRTRAGIPTVEESWVNTAGETLTKDLLRDIVRQERQIELYLENQNFWDMRRWLLAADAFGKKSQGLNIEATTLQDFNQVVEVNFERKFESPKNYLLPIPVVDINRNTKIIQNPGY